MRPFGAQRTRAKTKPKVVGDIRKTQLITTHGPGSIIDFVDDTVMIAGTDKWGWSNKSPDNKYIIYNENLQNYLSVDYFVEPKTDDKVKPFYSDKTADIPAYTFPEILYCTNCKRLFHVSTFKNRLSQNNRCSCGKDTLIPSRFVLICSKGHIEDFPYYEWVHNGKECEEDPGKLRISMFNLKGRSSIESLMIKCNACGKMKGMASAFMQGALTSLVECGGHSPWLEDSDGKFCGEELFTRVRSSSSVYFPATVSALSIPPWSEEIYKLVGNYYDDLVNAKNPITVIQKHLPYTFKDLGEREIEEAIKLLKKSKELKGKRSWADIYLDEYIALTRNKVDDEGEYSSNLLEPPIGYEDYIEKVVAIDRLTEVQAILGFTRLKPWSGKLDDEYLAELSSSEKNWLPAVKLRGEGIFIQFKVNRIEEWAESAKKYYEPMFNNFEKSWFNDERMTPEYVFLHTFAHLLIRRLSLESGYGITSLKERIYSTIPSPSGGQERRMAGVLIYTAAPDSDGSLGGLVDQSWPDRLGPLITSMCEEARWCSSDPLCIDSYGDQAQGFDSLNYAACYACTLLPETSCEFWNVLLDRAALIGTPDNPEVGMFR